MDIGALQVFACIVERGNLSAAARALNMTRSNVSRRLSALEASVGAPLLRRTTHEVSLTAAGELLYARARTISREIAAAQAEMCARGAEARGRIRVALPRSISQVGLSEVLTRFAVEHPSIALEVCYSNEPLELHANRVDIAIRIGRRPIESAVVMWRQEIEQAICASPAYLRERGVPSSPHELVEHSIITYAVRDGVIPLIASMMGNHEKVAVTASLRANDLEFVRDAAGAGLGIGLIARYAVGRAIIDGRLIELLPEYSFSLNRSKLYLQAQEVRYQTAPVKLLLSRMRERLMTLGLTRQPLAIRAVA